MAKNFGLFPTIRFNRSKFNMPQRVKTSMSVGTLYPISFVEVLPGDTFSCNMKNVTRATSAFIKPIMDNIYMDVYHFFVPLRLCYDDLEKVFGNPNPSAYVQTEFANIPCTTSPSNITGGTIADYLGLPVGQGFVPPGISILPFRAFAKIYNDWFRNENVIDEVYIQKGAFSETEVINNKEWSPNNYTGKPPKVGKRKDYFTSSLLKPQKGDPVNVPVVGSAKVVGNGPFRLRDTDPTNIGSDIFLHPASTLSGSQTVGLNAVNNGVSAVPSENALKYKDGLQVDLTSSSGTSINDLRFAFQLQKALERDMIFGGRYNEYLLGHYGVSSPDSRLQFSEYLGGGRIPINVQQATQMSQGTADSPLGNVGAFSLSVGSSKFSKGFVEHGYVFTVACIRQIHSYQQGVPKVFSRTERNHFYDPLFANLGFQPIYQTELYGLMKSDANYEPTSLRDNDFIFGYNEAWADYRFLPDMITGQMRSSSPSKLDIWHLGDFYDNPPTLSKNFVEENPDNVNRVLSVASDKIDNFIADFYFDTTAIRVMPVFSTPGLIDHH